MAFFHKPRIVTDGLIHLLEPNYFDGTSSETIPNKPIGSSWGVYNFNIGSGAGIKTLQSNVINDGSGTSHTIISRNSDLETGSITAIIWINMENIPLNVGGNNNWRGLLCTSNSGTNGNPLTMVMEQSYIINFSTTTTSGYKRFLNGNFAPVGADTNGWFMVSYTYDKTSGQAASYKNSSQINNGPMTSDGGGSNPTSPGESMVYSSYASGGFRVYGGTNSIANPNGNGYVPGELGNVLFYNKALSPDEITQTYNAYKTRYGL